ncbi:hypothetical protein HCN44_005080 [Aphidius gifuensis]|uniref:Alpha 1,4-glycosyltransferase domain-containing protein n=2 Tax=Aphidius gifuensis TaxID=684658 RepID=A0A834XV57_APHGI|nr:hypothetical protein HCN44_005080 [Aphidius gifuensis]
MFIKLTPAQRDDTFLDNYFDELPDKHDLINEKSSSSNIIFIQTNSLAKNGDQNKFTARQACAIESAARLNNNMNISIIILINNNINFTQNNYVKILNLHYRNIFFKPIIANEYFKDTPLDNWWTSGIFNNTSKYPAVQMSDIIRLIELWKNCGSIYSDLDVVIQKSLDNMTNFVGEVKNENMVANGVIGISCGILGKKFIEACLKYLEKYFDGNSWAGNGPAVITKILQKLCKTKKTSEMTLKKCKGFTVYPTEKFYPIHYSEDNLYFDIDDNYKIMNKIKNSSIISIWGYSKNNRTIKVGSNAPYGLVASKYCPIIYKNCENNIF